MGLSGQNLGNMSGTTQVYLTDQTAAYNPPQQHSGGLSNIKPNKNVQVQTSGHTGNNPHTEQTGNVLNVDNNEQTNTVQSQQTVGGLDNISENNIQQMIPRGGPNGSGGPNGFGPNVRGPNTGSHIQIKEQPVQQQHIVNKPHQIPRATGNGGGGKTQKRSGLKLFFYKMGKSFQKTFRKKGNTKHHTSRCARF